MWLSNLFSKIKITSTLNILSKGTMTSKFDKFKTLEEFGYGFNEDGQMRKLDPETGKPTSEPFDFNVSKDHSYNQKHYEALGEVVTDEVYKLLETKGLKRLYTPDNVPKEEASFIFCSQKDLKNPRKLIILIHGSGVVRAGQWSRSLIINHSLSTGTQIPYIEQAKKLGYEVLITNTNHHYYSTKDGSEKRIKNNIFDVWEKYVIGSNPDSVAIVAHSYGGVVTLELANKFPDFFNNKVFAIGLTDSVHSSSALTADTKKTLQTIGRNWVTSNEPINTLIKSSKNLDDIPRYSAGHIKHEWTSSSCMDVLFEFFEKKYEEFNETQTTIKKPKLDL